MTEIKGRPAKKGMSKRDRVAYHRKNKEETMNIKKNPIDNGTVEQQCRDTIRLTVHRSGRDHSVEVVPHTDRFLYSVVKFGVRT